MDTTYFGRRFGVMVFKDSLSGTILYSQYVKYETNHLYLLGIKEIIRRGVSVQSIICDGRKGL
ncbi:MAG: transposase, partial [Bacteroidales bacterium]|nr:transposase [Bacteroidales bacterium]